MKLSLTHRTITQTLDVRTPEVVSKTLVTEFWTLEMNGYTIPLVYSFELGDIQTKGELSVAHLVTSILQQYGYDVVEFKGWSFTHADFMHTVTYDIECVDGHIDILYAPIYTFREVPRHDPEVFRTIFNFPVALSPQQHFIFPPADFKFRVIVVLNKDTKFIVTKTTTKQQFSSPTEVKVEKLQFTYERKRLSIVPLSNE